jgi:flavin-dependent dehydrogenase
VTAAALAREGASVVILERGDDRGDKPGESIPPAARPLLERLGLWDQLARDRHRPCHGNRSSWGSDGADELPFLFTPYGHGWHVDRRRFEQLLQQRAIDAGVVRRTRTRVVDATSNASGWRLRCDDGAEVEAVFAVDATGRASWLARRAGARRVVDDTLVALVAFLENDGGDRPDSFTLVEAVEQGWWYTAVVPDGRLAAMFVTDPGVVHARGVDACAVHARAARTAHGWESLLAAAPRTRDRIAQHGYTLRTSPRYVDAGSARLEAVAGDGWLAVGDAALALDPLSSHGIGSALAGGIDAAAAIVSGSTHEYSRKLDILWSAYRTTRRATYAIEQRWKDSPFWQRRQHGVHHAAHQPSS